MIYHIPLEMIDANPWQTRDEPDAEHIKELAEDIRLNGLLQTPAGRLVDEHGHAVTDEHFKAMMISDGSWSHLQFVGFRVQIAFGHNRLAAGLALKWVTFPVEVRWLTDVQMAQFAWSENERRKDLTPMERARAIRQRMDAFGWTQEQAGKHLGLSRSTVANILRLLDLPEDVQDDVQAGTLSERQAQALVPLAEIPEEVLQAAEGASWSYIKPSEIVKSAKKGEASDEIRQRVKRIVENYSVLLAAAAWPLDHAFEGDGFKSAKCEGCEHTMKRGDAIACTVKACFEAKEKAWREIQLVKAGEQTGIAVLGKDDVTAEYWFNGDDGVRQGIVAGTCEHRRLRSANYGAQIIDGIGLVCCNPSGECECYERIRKERLENDPEAKAQRELKAALQKLYDEAGAKLGQALAEGHAPAWLAVYRRVNGSTGNPSWSVAQIQEKIGRDLVKPRFVQDHDLRAARRAVAAELDALGLNAGDELTPAEEAEKKFERIGMWMENLPEELPTVEALRGNIANLVKLLPLGDGDFKVEVNDAHATLCGLLQVIQQPDWDAEEFHWVRDVLENTDGGEGGFEKFASRAPACALRYVLALVKEYPEWEYEAGVIEEILLEDAVGSEDNLSEVLTPDRETENSGLQEVEG